MRVKAIFIGIFFYCIAHGIAHGQILSHADSTSINKANLVVTKVFKLSSKSNYLLFSIGDRWYYIAVKKNGSFHQYYMDIDSVASNRFPIRLPYSKTDKSILERAFNENLYHSGYINYNSDFYKSGKYQAEGNFTYIYLFKRGVKYGEARLSIFIEPNPIDKAINDYLRKTILIAISKQ